MKTTSKSAEYKEELKKIHKYQEEKWYLGNCGGATSLPYRVKRYLTKELSDKIRAEVQIKYNEWVEKLNSIKPNKRWASKHSWCEELSPQEYADYDHVDCSENAIPTKVCGHDIFVAALHCIIAKNGHAEIVALPEPRICLSRYLNTIYDTSISGTEFLRFTIHWDENKQLYYICEYYRVETKKSGLSSRGFNRSMKKAEYKREVKALEENLIEKGINIIKLVLDEYRDCEGFNHINMTRSYIECESPEVVE